MRHELEEFNDHTQQEIAHSVQFWITIKPPCGRLEASPGFLLTAGSFPAAWFGRVSPDLLASRLLCNFYFARSAQRV
jgi:hypothetical protein